MIRACCLFLFLYFGLTNCFGQSKYPEINALRRYKLDSLETSKYDSLTNVMMQWQVVFLKNFNIYSDHFSHIRLIDSTQNNNILGKFLYYINQGDYYFYKYEDQNLEARNAYVKALEIALEENTGELVCESIKRILRLYRYNYLVDNTTTSYYLNLYHTYAYDNLEKQYLNYYNLILSFQYFKGSKWNEKLSNELLEYANSDNDSFLSALIYHLHSSYYAHIKDYDKAITSALKALNYFNQISYQFKSTPEKATQIALTRFYLMNDEFEKASVLLESIDKLNRNKLDYDFDRYNFFYQSMLDTASGNYNQAFDNIYEYLRRTEKSILSNNKIEIKELEAKYQSELKEKQILEQEKELLIEKEQKMRARNAVIVIGIVLFLSIIIAILIYRNSKRKQLLIIQNKDIEKQKVTTLLKEQELATIDAMIDGQEKERQRIANDLHDDLGGLMATIRLHFDSLKENGSDKLYEKTNSLIDEAYHKIRAMAHAKNSGVIAKEGLVRSVKMMAEKVTIANNLEITVMDHGLDNRLENSLELNLFRIIQELITNVVKHAQATEANIHLTNHGDSLNIMIEDNGIGFNRVQLVENKKGMGSRSIDKRIASMEGSMDIDSEVGRGTNKINNIPQR